jgi:hypothetical protein
MNMQRVSCPYEEATSVAARSGKWDSRLEKHAHECVVCQEVVLASSWMQTLGQETAQDRATDHDSRDASLLWWRAQLTEKQARAEQAQSVLDWTEVFVACAVAAALAGWALWNWALMQAGVDWLVTNLSPQTWMAAYMLGNLSWSALIVLSLAVLLVAYPILAGE